MSDEGDRRSPFVSRRLIGATVVALLVISLWLAMSGRIPTAPLFLLAAAVLVGGLWWLADTGGRFQGRPLASALEALATLGAVLAAIAVFWMMLGAFT